MKFLKTLSLFGILFTSFSQSSNAITIRFVADRVFEETQNKKIYYNYNMTRPNPFERIETVTIRFTFAGAPNVEIQLNLEDESTLYLPDLNFNTVSFRYNDFPYYSKSVSSGAFQRHDSVVNIEAHKIVNVPMQSDRIQRQRKMMSFKMVNAE